MGTRPNLGAHLTAAEIAENFADLHPPLSHTQAGVEAARCLYCYDAPCVKACPTAIDIPGFIHRIRSGNLEGSAKLILSANIMGGTCGRACPTEVLCEEVCVLNARDEEPVKIGQLQRHAVEHLIESGSDHPFRRATPTGKRLAVVGSGPAGLSFAHRGAMLGHAVTVFEAKAKPGGLNEYGLAAYKMAGNFAQKEVEFLLGIGGIAVEHGRRAPELGELRKAFDAVFIGAGLGGSNRLGVPGEELPGVDDALDFIAEIRQAANKSSVNAGDEVVVIGGGNTAIDAAVQARRLGARNVTLVYRRGAESMGATAWEQDLARTNDVTVRLWSTPVRFDGDARVGRVTFARTRLNGKLETTDETWHLPADRVLLAIGQYLQNGPPTGLKRDGGKLWVDENYQTSLPGVFAGGDCINRGEDLTVRAVEDGKRAALAADAWLRGA